MTTIHVPSPVPRTIKRLDFEVKLATDDFQINDLAFDRECCG